MADFPYGKLVNFSEGLGQASNIIFSKKKFYHIVSDTYPQLLTI